MNKFLQSEYNRCLEHLQNHSPVLSYNDSDIEKIENGKMSYEDLLAANRFEYARQIVGQYYSISMFKQLVSSYSGVIV